MGIARSQIRISLETSLKIWAMPDPTLAFRLRHHSKYGSCQIQHEHFALDIIEHVGHARFNMSISLETSLNIWVLPDPKGAFRLRHHSKYGYCQIPNSHFALDIIENMGHAISNISISLETSLSMWVMLCAGVHVFIFCLVLFCVVRVRPLFFLIFVGSFNFPSTWLGALKRP